MSLAKKLDNYSFSSIHNVEANYLLWKVSSKIASSSSHNYNGISLLGLPGSESIGILTYHVMSPLLHLENVLPLGTLGLNTFNHPWTYQVTHSNPLPALASLVLSYVSGRMCHGSFLMSNSSCSLLDGGFMTSHNSQHVERITYWSHDKRLIAQGSFITAFNPLATQSKVLHRQRFSSSVCQIGAGWCT